MMPGFFKEMPKDFNAQGEWRIRVYRISLMRDHLEYEAVYKGKKGMAYFRIRLRALWQDWKTMGAESGIGWSMRSAETDSDEMEPFGIS